MDKLRQRKETYKERTSRSDNQVREITTEAQQTHHEDTSSDVVHPRPCYVIHSCELTSQYGTNDIYIEDVLPGLETGEEVITVPGGPRNIDDDSNRGGNVLQADQGSSHSGGGSDRYSENLSPVDRTHHDEISCRDVPGPSTNNQEHEEEIIQVRIENFPSKENWERSREVAVSSSRERTLNLVSQISMEQIVNTHENEVKEKSVRTESQTNNEQLPKSSRGSNSSIEASEEGRCKDKEDMKTDLKKRHESSLDDGKRNHSKNIVKIFPSTSKKSDSDDQEHRLKLESSKKSIKSIKKIIRKRHSSDSSGSSQRRSRKPSF
ncbi:uncharacterized protein TNCT_77681 [Trichonephila clavata]|uniref:Uncharacterized protein n=1 Tax=Trichonephila clavata TaxID=2740835 RepID=A0A8X6J9M6_TRICU|nr:uncharacterized protein TNCT_77681 [Trichonephila clavata]